MIKRQNFLYGLDTVILWGRGVRGEYAYDFFYQNGVQVLAVIDSNEDYQNTLWHNIKVISFEEYKKIYSDINVVVTIKNFQPVITQMRELGLNNVSNFDEYNGYLSDHVKANERIYSNLGADYQLRKFVDFTQKWIAYVLSDDKKNVSTSPLIELKKYSNVTHCIKNDETLIGYRIVLGDSLSKHKYDLDNQIGDSVLFHGLSSDYYQAKFLLEAMISKMPIVYGEDGFIRSIEPLGNGQSDYNYKKTRSVVFCYNGTHINAQAPTYLEYLLNSDTKIDENKIIRAKQLISKIRAEKISKYNCQPDIKLNIGRKGKKKILVLDQVVRDKSISYGLASENTFSEMLETAIAENPDADIIIKTHPQINTGHFADIEENENVYVVNYGVNPISMLEYVDKVYVCTSQMGFEALMCGKEVHVFGMPFYAGWGVTHDRLKCERRTRKRSVEEIFYFAYIEYSHYISYETNSECEIEQCIDELLQLRQEYFKEMNRTNSENEYICTPPMD